MGVNRGKDFEKAIKESLKMNDQISVDRFPDPMAGYAGISNICDFGVYKYPFKYYFECKAFSGNTLNFKAGITEDQWKGMHEKSSIYGVIAGVIVWFIDHDITSFIPIQELVQLQESGAKSLNVKHILNNEITHFNVPGKKKRVFFSYEAEPFMEHLQTWYTKYWEERK